MQNNKFEEIVGYFDLIKGKSKSVNFFHIIDAINKKFIINGTKVKLLPSEYSKLYSSDEFWISVDLDKKEIIYYAYDVENIISENNINEKEGYITWDELETPIFNFFVMNIKELTTATYPHTDKHNTTSIIEPTNKYVPPIHNNTPYTNNLGHNNNYGYPHQNNQFNNPFSYGTAAYKEREAFYDKLWPLIKENKTAQAIDHIDTTISLMSTEKKFDELSYLIRHITFDKLNIPTMLHMLKTTSDLSASFKERKEFFEKVKTHLNKSKPSMTNRMLNGLEPVEPVLKDIGLN